MPIRAIIKIEGVVQGVGFRPFVHRLSRIYGLCGYVCNTAEGVKIEAEGRLDNIRKFYQGLHKDPPPLSRIIRKSMRSAPLKGYADFVIRQSKRKGILSALASPDIATCNDCLKELFSPKNRRYLYPFINCTNCGPRFSIIRSLPYDRPFTTMRKFGMCPDCKAEYTDTADRRYHAQPACCGLCGPRIELLKVMVTKSPSHKVTYIAKGADAIKGTARLLKAGNIAAIKGIGGFHIACDAENVSAVRLLRRRKGRQFKPFAVMADDIRTIKQFCRVTELETKILTSPERPIVLLRKKAQSRIMESLAPNNNYLGVMLPYAPLHHLLFSGHPAKEPSLAMLVMTSANLADEPIEIDNDRVIDRLKGTCDYFLLHDRDIYNRTDDSIVQVMDKKPVILRRSRGYCPLPFPVSKSMKHILACGAELKGTFCLTRGKFAFLSQYIGDLKTYLTFSFYKEAVSRMMKLFAVRPAVIAGDLHPDYLSSLFARVMASKNKAGRLIPVQHHQAHIASVIAEHRIKKDVIGIAFDGVGLGADGKIWGGEFFTGNLKAFRRRARIEYVPMPGGDHATREPYRMAISYLYAAFGEDIYNLKIGFIKRRKNNLHNIIAAAKSTPLLTSSAGRLFDGVSSLLGVCDIITYEAQAAIELQMLAERSRSNGAYAFGIEKTKDFYIVKPQETIRRIAGDLIRELPAADIARKFHNGLAGAAVDICRIIRRESAIDTVCLSGGVFQNRLFLEILLKGLRQLKFKTYYNELVPANDGAVSLGQAVIADQICA